MDNGFNGSNGYPQAPKQKSGCGGCLGCCLGVLAIIILLTVGAAGYSYYWINENGRKIVADGIDKTVASVTESSFKDEKAKTELVANVKAFTDKIRNKEIGFTEVINGITSLQNQGAMERIALLGLYGNSVSKESVFDEEEKQALSQTIKALYDGKIETKQLSQFGYMLSAAANKNGEGYNTYENDSIKKMDQKKLHEALSYLKQFVKDQKLEVTNESNFKIEQYINTEVDTVFKAIYNSSSEKGSKEAKTDNK